MDYFEANQGTIVAEFLTAELLQTLMRMEAQGKASYDPAIDGHYPIRRACR